MILIWFLIIIDANHHNASNQSDRKSKQLVL
jgi:hypothetical protein